MIKLSFSTINQLYLASHSWLNKQMGAKAPDNIHFQNGKRLHRIIQDHVAGIKTDERLTHIKYTFPIVEIEEFDKRTHFEINVDNQYSVHGYIDGLDQDNKRFLEIKTGGTMWSIGDFKKSYQRKIYALAHEDFTESILITAIGNDDQWKFLKPKVYKMALTDKDREEALEWIKGAIKIIEAGDFSGGLDENGKCKGYCYYGYNCQFR